MFDIADERINHEMRVFGRNMLHNDLDDMVSILVADTVENVVLKLINHSGLLVNKNMLQSLENISIRSQSLEAQLTVCTTLQPYTWQDSS